MPHATNTMVAGDFPYITNSAEERFVTDIKDGTRIGYKYFDFDRFAELSVCYRSTQDGIFEVWNAEEIVGQIELTAAGEWAESGCALDLSGTHPLFLIYRGKGAVDLLNLSFR